MSEHHGSGTPEPVAGRNTEEQAAPPRPMPPGRPEAGREPEADVEATATAPAFDTDSPVRPVTESPGEGGSPADRADTGDQDTAGSDDAATDAAAPAPGADVPAADNTEPAPPASTPAEVPPSPPAPRPGPPPAAPGPRPGPSGRVQPPQNPRPIPPRSARPQARPAPPAVPAAEPVAVGPSSVPAASADPGRWGRVDADGTIYVRTADGERAVGEWQAGAPDEGLAHFARRFDDLLTEVELLATRLTAGGGDPKHALQSAKALRDGLDTATVVGDIEGLRARLDELVAAAEAAVDAARSAREAQRSAAVARKEELAAEAEHLAAESTQWKQAGDRFKAILDEWRTIRGIDRKTDELLWKRFAKARESFNRRRGAHFADLDRQRAAAKARKEELVVEAEKLVDSEDWGPTAARFRDLMAEWKAAGRAQKEADDALWQRFRAAQDTFFTRRSRAFAERDAEFAANAEAKKALLAEAERIDTSDPTAARAALRGIQERWDEIGKVPRDEIRPLEARLRAVEEKVREAADRQWRRTDPEAEARVAQFRERVAQFEAQAEKARAAGDTRRAQEAQRQADQWREWLATAEQAVQQR